MTTSPTTPTHPVAQPASGKPTSESNSPKQPTKPSSTLVTKTSPANPEWAAEVAAQFGLSGPLSKAAVASILDAIQIEISKKFNRPRLAKIIRQAVTKSIA